MLAWLAIGLSSIAMVCGAAALAAVHFGGTLHYGDVGGWLGGIGSILAAAAAVSIAIYRNDRQNRKEDAERSNAEARAKRRARRVVVKGDRYDAQDPVVMRFLNTGDQDAYHLELHNTGATPIYEVTWSPPLVAYIPYTPPGQLAQPRLEWAEDAVLMDHPIRDVDEIPSQGQGTNIRDMDPFVLAPGGSAEIRVTIQNIREGPSKYLPFTTYNRVSYVDEDGYQIGWIYRRINETVPITAENSVRGHWALVDDDYPKNVNDAIRELVEQAPKCD
jgi:hypothetical protein